jgi:hypothetical protein
MNSSLLPLQLWGRCLFRHHYLAHSRMLLEDAAVISWNTSDMFSLMFRPKYSQDSYIYYYIVENITPDI